MKRDLYRFAKTRRDKEYYTLLSWNDKDFNNKELMKKYLIKEIEFHLRKLNDETIDKDDFVNAITEIVEHYKD